MQLKHFTIWEGSCAWNASSIHYWWCLCITSLFASVCSS